MGSTRLSLLGIIPPLRLCHVTSEKRQRSRLVLVNEEHHKVSSCCCLTIGHIEVFAWYTTFLCTTRMRIGEEHWLDFLRSDSVLACNLVHEVLFPDHFIETHRHTRS